MVGWVEGVYYRFQGFVVNSMLCTWGDKKYSRLRYSGGPILAAGSARAANDMQVSIVRFCAGCASPDVPGIYSRMLDQINWIDGVFYDMLRSPLADFRCKYRIKSLPVN